MVSLEATLLGITNLAAPPEITPTDGSFLRVQEIHEPSGIRNNKLKKYWQGIYEDPVAQITCQAINNYLELQSGHKNSHDVPKFTTLVDTRRIATSKEAIAIQDNPKSLPHDDVDGKIVIPSEGITHPLALVKAVVPRALQMLVEDEVYRSGQRVKPKLVKQRVRKLMKKFLHNPDQVVSVNGFTISYSTYQIQIADMWRTETNTPRFDVAIKLRRNDQNRNELGVAIQQQIDANRQANLKKIYRDMYHTLFDTIVARFSDAIQQNPRNIASVNLDANDILSQALPHYFEKKPNVKLPILYRLYDYTLAKALKYIYALTDGADHNLKSAYGQPLPFVNYEIEVELQVSKDSASPNPLKVIFSPKAHMRRLPLKQNNTF
ncbi:hypothetical protein C4579_02540 [Candidatus Microgenomates bacterium]|nr:MAG: hypothetical protein C4579_02540 [Candidatus Microgenomates bacterium]